MDIKDVQGKSEAELREVLKKAKADLAALNVKVHENQLKDVRKIRNTRKTIARILTLLNAKKVA